MPSRQEHLSELAQRARKSLPREAAEALVVEARDHLDADVAARLELGAAPEVAEAEAVAAFGPAGRLVRQMAAVRQGRWHTPALAALTVASAAWLPLALSGAAWALSSAALLFVAAHTRFTYACVARRPAWSALLAVAGFALVSTTLLTAFCGPFYGGPMGRSALGGIARLYGDAAEARARREARYGRAGWPSDGLRARTIGDRLVYARASAEARQAAHAVDLPGSIRASVAPTLVFAAYLALVYAFGAWGERLMARGSRWVRWDFWRPE